METNYQKVLPPGLHAILGDSAAGTFKCVFHPGERLLIDPDVLCCGPTPPRVDLKAWSALRLEYWRGFAPLEEDVARSTRAEDNARSPHDLLANLDRLRDAERFTLWAATGLSEQLFIASTVELAIGASVDPAKISIVQFETLKDRGGLVLGTGELNEQFMSGHPDPVPLSANALRDYRDAWMALTSPDPTLIERFAQTHPDANPWLKRAMLLLLRRFPEKQSGLPYWDRILLREARAHNPKAARVIGNTIVHYWQDGDLVGDYYLFGRMLRLGSAALPRPLLELSGDLSNMRNTEVRLTPFGNDVLEGRASSYPANPIDDWASGVKLSSANGAVWFYEDGRLARG